jgi:PAB-dependent poly(A)-specific ribonuclease subunit 3
VIQLTSALRAIHAAGLACRVVDVSKVLVTGRSRIAIGSTGIYDVLQYEESTDTPAATAHFAQKDMHDLGMLVLTLGCAGRGGQFQDAVQAMHYISRSYTEDMFKLLRYLLSPPSPGHHKSLHDLMPMIGARFYTGE